MAELSQFIKAFGDIKMLAKIMDVQPTRSGKGWCAILDNGSKVYIFDQSFLNLIKSGYTVDLTLTQQGAYTHVKGVAPGYYGQPKPIQTSIPGTTPEATTQPEPEPEPPQPEPQPMLMERVYKNRISALQASVQYIAGALGGTAKEEDVIKIAQKFESYLENGK